MPEKALNGFCVRAPQTDAQWQAYYDLRWRVLRQPWQQPRGSEQDELESQALHLAVFDTTEQLLACGRLHFLEQYCAQIRYMAVEPDRQSQGLGTILLRRLETLAWQNQVTEIRLDARESCLAFYLKQGYLDVGVAHTLFGDIPHRKLRKLSTA